MTITALYQIAEKEKIPVLPFALPNAESCSIMDENGDCYIGIDPYAIRTQAEERVKLAHEIGHCSTGAFYNQFSRLSVRGKCERKADTWAIQKLIPKDELRDAVKHGITEVWDLADYFGVTIQFMRKAAEYYA